MRWLRTRGLESGSLSFVGTLLDLPTCWFPHELDKGNENVFLRGLLWGLGHNAKYFAEFVTYSKCSINISYCCRNKYIWVCDCFWMHKHTWTHVHTSHWYAGTWHEETLKALYWSEAGEMCEEKSFSWHPSALRMSTWNFCSVVVIHQLWLP